MLAWKIGIINHVSHATDFHPHTHTRHPLMAMEYNTISLHTIFWLIIVFDYFAKNLFANGAEIFTVFRKMILDFSANDVRLANTLIHLLYYMFLLQNDKHNNSSRTAYTESIGTRQTC